MAATVRTGSYEGSEMKEQLQPAVSDISADGAFARPSAMSSRIQSFNAGDKFQEFSDRRDSNKRQHIIPCEFILKLLASSCVLLTTFSRL
ncbi:hypothetical protein WN944_015757 [Citrus x changshan-huyou]|uniref:Uncharacterized protein n=1 Tax=Citrus x changshan-huyou TaxID=2935761 RepID=A0AAP0M861_9ROSI